MSVVSFQKMDMQCRKTWVVPFSLLPFLRFESYAHKASESTKINQSRCFFEKEMNNKTKYNSYLGFCKCVARVVHDPPGHETLFCVVPTVDSCDVLSKQHS